MASSTTQIANLALGKIGQSRIEALTEESKEARWANEFFGQARDYTTESALWRHAKKTLTLEETDNDREDDYAFAYVRPSDCLKVARILSSSGAFDPRYPIRFDCEGDVIYTDEAIARGVYVRQVTDVTKFVPSFTDAVAWQLAHLLVQPLRLENSLIATTLQGYDRAMGHAIAMGAAEQLIIWTADEAAPDWITGR